MGVYVYTLRKNVIIANGKFKIARYDFAYKYGFRVPERIISRLENQGRTALLENYDATGVILGEFEEGVTVYIPHKLSFAIFDASTDKWQKIGKLKRIKQGRKRVWIMS